MTAHHAHWPDDWSEGHHPFLFLIVGDWTPSCKPPEAGLSHVGSFLLLEELLASSVEEFTPPGTLSRFPIGGSYVSGAHCTYDATILDRNLHIPLTKVGSSASHIDWSYIFVTRWTTKTQGTLTLFRLGGGRNDPRHFISFITPKPIIWLGWNFLTFPNF